ncbi:protein ORF85 [Lake sturgeon herpesvirus]|nr:protein ORF85 [Lake sturgeon herpesvirus]
MARRWLWCCLWCLWKTPASFGYDTLTVTHLVDQMVLTASFTDQTILVKEAVNYTITVPPSTAPLTLVLTGPLTPPPKTGVDDFEILFYFSVAVWVLLLISGTICLVKWAYVKTPIDVFYKRL